MRSSPKIIFYGFILSLFCLGITRSFADVGVNIVIANPSDDIGQDVKVRYDLPPGLGRDDILETGELSVEYDLAGSVYVLTGTIFLNPKETRTVRVTIRDIWNIPQERFRFIENMLDEQAGIMEATVDKSLIEPVVSEMRYRIEEVEEYQRDNQDDIQKRMEMYPSNLEKLRRVEERIFSLPELIKADENRDGDDMSVSLFIEATNPSDEGRTLPVKYDLPREIIPQHVEESGGMEIKHDVARNIFYLHTEPWFEPKETKRFSIRLKNVWMISEGEVQGYVKEASELFDWFEDREEVQTAGVLFESIKNKAAQIIETQSSAESLRDRVAAFRENEMRLRKIKEDLERLKLLKLRITDAEFQTPKASDATAESVREMLEEEIFKAIRELSERLFREKLTASTVWRIVMLVVSFAAVLSAVFYAIWAIRVKKDDERGYEKIE